MLLRSSWYDWSGFAPKGYGCQHWYRSPEFFSWLSRSGAEYVEGEKKR